MKNKMISAMLLGMSATMAVPATAVFAEDLAEPSALEEVAAETPAEPVETPVAETEAEVSYDNDANEAQAEAPVIEEDVVEEGETAEVQIAEMAAYATDEEQKEADTPSDFKDKLSDFEFEAGTFGKYGAQLTEFINGDEIDNSNYEEQHNNYAKKVFYDLAKRLDADVNGNEMSAVYADDTTIRCVLFPLDAEILVSVSVHATRDIGAMYASYITSNYPELMSSFDEESGLFSVRTYSSPDEYEPEGTQDLLELCITASKACVNEYKQTLEKKDSADFASDVQQILAEQTETVWEREKAVAAREEEMANKEAEMMQREEELNQKLKELEEEKKRIQNEAEEERQKMKDHEAEMEEKIKAYEDRNTKDILNIQQLANQVAALQNRQNALGKVDDKAEEEIFRMKNKVQQLTSQKIALEKKLTEKITGKDAKIRELSDVITQKDSEYKKLESNIDDRVNSRVSDEVKKTDVKIKQLEAELSKIGHILTPEEMIDYLEQYIDAKIAKRHTLAVPGTCISSKPYQLVGAGNA